MSRWLTVYKLYRYKIVPKKTVDSEVCGLSTVTGSGTLLERHIAVDVFKYYSLVLWAPYWGRSSDSQPGDLEPKGVPQQLWFERIKVLASRNSSWKNGSNFLFTATPNGMNANLNKHTYCFVISVKLHPVQYQYSNWHIWNMMGGADERAHELRIILSFPIFFMERSLNLAAPMTVLTWSWTTLWSFLSCLFLESITLDHESTVNLQNAFTMEPKSHNNVSDLIEWVVLLW